MEFPIKDSDKFIEVDPYNKQNTLSGYISRQSTEYYGALMITEINGGKIEPQIIMGTPKMHYPFYSQFDGQRKFNFPSATKIEIFEKLDGTNILSFFYYFKGYRFMSFKTRLRPFLNPESKWGNFYEMWNEVAFKDFDDIKNLMIKYGCNLSFELFGLKNPHLVVYDVPLDYKLLFGVTNNANIISPVKINNNPDFSNSIKIAPLFDTITSQYVENYKYQQNNYEKSLKKVDDETYSGIEGSVWYHHSIDGKIMQFKCKPETIETIHFSAGKGISKNSIMTTCWNALENTDTLTLDFIKGLLREEFDDRLIESKHYLIQQCIDIVMDDLKLRNSVLDLYTRIGIDIKADKVAVMRKMSESFDKRKMSKVYSVIKNWG